MKRHDNIYAVVGAAESCEVVRAPADKYEARTMRSDAKASDTSFYCSVAVGGCGGKLKLAAGDVRVPYFSHAPEAACSLTDSSARDGYTHLAIQKALQLWVEQSPQLQCDLEVTTLDQKGRSDLVIGSTNDSRRLGLEVQLSPLTYDEMQRRSAIYLKAVHHVQWLYGYEDNQACWGEVEVRGYALRVRIDMQTLDCALGFYGFHGAHDIGSFQTTWRPLADWIIRPNGLFSPSIKAVLEEAREQAERLYAAKPPRPSKPAAPTVPAYEALYESLSRRFQRTLFPDNAAIRLRVINAIHRRTAKGQLDETTATELLEWLSRKPWSSWWKTLLGTRSKDAEIIIHVIDVYSRRRRDSKT
jgi:hypothetical protein